MSGDDFALLDQWCAGDQAAGNALFKRHFETVYRFFEHKTDGDIDDLVQETFLACVKSRDNFRRQSGFEHVGGFVELGYVARLFPSVAYEGLPASGFPDDLGERLYTGGVMLRVGGTVALKAEKTTKEDKVSCGSRSVTVVHEKDQTIRPKCDKDYLLIEFVDPN